MKYNISLILLFLVCVLIASAIWIAVVVGYISFVRFLVGG